MKEKAEKRIAQNVKKKKRMNEKRTGGKNIRIKKKMLL